MKKINSFIYTLCSTLLLLCTSSAYADTSPWIDEQSIMPFITVLVVALAALIIVGLLLYGCVKNISAKGAFLASCASNAIIACISIPLIHFAHLGWWDALFKFNEAPVHTISLWILLYLASSLIAVAIVHVLFHYPVKQLLIPIGIGNFIIFILIINAYIFVTLYRFKSEANVVTKTLMRIFNTLRV